MPDRFLLCFACGSKNRVPDKRGIPKCGRCGDPLQIPRGTRSWSIDPYKVVFSLIGIVVAAWITYENFPLPKASKPAPAILALERGQARIAEIRRGRSNSFSTTGNVNGKPIGIVVDTGATSVVLTYEAAIAADIPAVDLKYTVNVDTANGRTTAARITLDRISVGGITERFVPAMVAQRGALTTSLLGMTFLNRLDSWEVRGDRLIMRGRN